MMRHPESTYRDVVDDVTILNPQGRLMLVRPVITDLWASPDTNRCVLTSHDISELSNNNEFVLALVISIAPHRQYDDLFYVKALLLGRVGYIDMTENDIKQALHVFDMYANALAHVRLTVKKNSR